VSESAKVTVLSFMKDIVLCEVKELPTKLQVGNEHGRRGSHLNLLQLTTPPRVDHELPSARSGEIAYKYWDRRCCGERCVGRTLRMAREKAAFVPEGRDEGSRSGIG